MTSLRRSTSPVPRRFLILGGARSGKSSFAENLALQIEGSVTMIATAEPIDSEMVERIAVHRVGRPADWATIEEPRNIAQALARVPSADTAVLDCITVWLGNMLHHGHEEAAITDELERLVSTMAQRRGSTVIVSNEVGLGIVPDNELGRTYRDIIGRVNTRLASAVDRPVFLVAGMAVDLRNSEDILRR